MPSPLIRYPNLAISPYSRSKAKLQKSSFQESSQSPFSKKTIQALILLWEKIIFIRADMTTNASDYAACSEMIVQYSYETGNAYRTPDAPIGACLCLSARYPDTDGLCPGLVRVSGVSRCRCHLGRSECLC